MKKHNTLKVALITLLLFALIAWILPGAVFQSEYSSVGRSQVGLFDLMSTPCAEKGISEHSAAKNKKPRIMLCTFMQGERACDSTFEISVPTPALSGSGSWV